MIYELIMFISEVNGDKGFTATKNFPTEAACIEGKNELWNKAKKEFSEEFVGKVRMEFKCEPRPDGFVRETDVDPSPSSPSPNRSNVAPTRPAPRVISRAPVSTAPTARDRAQITIAIRQKMIDPASLRVNSIIVYPPINGVKGACAVINAKNRFGGYTGNQSMIIYHENGAWKAGSATDALDCNDLRELHRNRAMRR